MGMLSTFASLLSLVAFVGWIWLVVVAFKQKTLWGVLVLLLSPIAAIFFAIKYWDDAKRPFLVHISCFVLSFGLTAYLFLYMTSPMMSMAMDASQGGEMDPNQMAAQMNTILDRVEEVGDLDAEEQRNLKRMRGMLDGMEAEAGAEASGETGRSAEVDRILAANAGSAGAQPAPSRSPLSKAPAPTKGAASNPTPTLGVSRDGYLTVATDAADEHLGETVKVIELGGNKVVGKLASADDTRLFLEKMFSTGTITIEVARQDITSFQVYMR